MSQERRFWLLLVKHASGYSLLDNCQHLKPTLLHAGMQPDTPDDNSVSCAPVSAAQHEANKTKAEKKAAKKTAKKQEQQQRSVVEPSVSSPTHSATSPKTLAASSEAALPSTQAQLSGPTPDPEWGHGQVSIGYM